MNLRQRIRKGKISCQPWKQYKGEIKLLPISAQCLFANNGLSWDVLEIELRNEGWLTEEENLWDVLAHPLGLYRTLEHEAEKEPFDETWTEEDYINYYKEL